MSENMVNLLSDPFYLITPLIAASISFTLVILILRRTKKKLPEWLFSCVLISLGSWGLFIFAMRVSPNVEYALYWDTAAVPSGIAMFILYYHFVCAYTRKTNKKLLLVAYSFLVAVFILSANGLVISHMAYTKYGYAPYFYPTMYAFSVGGFLFMSLALKNLVSTRRTSSRYEDRTRLAYMIIAIIILFSFGIVDLFPDHLPMSIFGNMAFGIITAVAILRYHLLDINIVIRRGSAYVLMSTIVAVPFMVLMYLSQQLLKQAVPLGALIALLIAIALAFNPLWQRVQRLVDRWFYRKRYDFLKELQYFIQESHDITDLKQLGSSLVKAIDQALQISSTYLL